MWICSKLGFFSVVQKEPDEFHLRARCRKDLDNLRIEIMKKQTSVPKPPLVEGLADPPPRIMLTRDADYRYRMILTQQEWTAFAFELFSTVDYPNFKGVISQTKDQADKYTAYAAFHHDMERWQRDKHQPVPKVPKHTGEPFAVIEGVDDPAAERRRQLRRLIPGIENATD